VWCAISRNRIIGPIFFDNIINSERYCEVILSPFIGHLNEDEIARGYFNKTVLLHTQLVFPCRHCAMCSGTEEFHRIFGHHSRPILHPPDYYLRGAMKGAVYKDSPHTLLELKEAIANFIRNVPPIKLSCVFANKIGRVDGCLSTSTWGAISNISCNLSMRNVFMYRDSLNIFIVCGTCTVTSGSPCIIFRS
jgi:hypothetical protein